MFIPYDIANYPLNSNEWSFPFTECIHISMFAMSIGTIALVDLRMLGVGLRHQTPAQILKDTGIWTLVGLIIVVTSGFVIWASDPLRYYYNWSFRYKIIALALAILYNYTIHRKVALSASSQSIGGKLVATLSLLLWISIVFAGLFYAFT
ncbi:MAG: hypothetical protein LAP38_10305 [Acidobacteriia bacterium]|nr:hypothetical protein [Terriglobia bacterium]